MLCQIVHRPAGLGTSFRGEVRRIFLKIKGRAIYDIVFAAGACCAMRSCICRVRCGTRPIMR